MFNQLTPEQQNKLVQAAMQGSMNNNANASRARASLSSNNDFLEAMMRRAGMEMPGMSNEEGVGQFHNTEAELKRLRGGASNQADAEKPATRNAPKPPRRPASIDAQEDAALNQQAQAQVNSDKTATNETSDPAGQSETNVQVEQADDGSLVIPAVGVASLIAALYGVERFARSRNKPNTQNPDVMDDDSDLSRFMPQDRNRMSQERDYARARVGAEERKPISGPPQSTEVEAKAKPINSPPDRIAIQQQMPVMQEDFDAMLKRLVAARPIRKLR